MRWPTQESHLLTWRQRVTCLLLFGALALAWSGCASAGEDEVAVEADTGSDDTDGGDRPPPVPIDPDVREDINDATDPIDVTDATTDSDDDAPLDDADDTGEADVDDAEDVPSPDDVRADADPDATEDIAEDTATDTSVDPDIAEDTAADTVEDTAEDTDTDPGHACGTGTPCGVDECCYEPCTAHLAPCSSIEEHSAGFFCDVDRGHCLERCDTDDPEAERGDNCPTRSFCIELTGVPDGTTLDGVCLDAECDSVFDLDACEGVGTCTAATCTCRPFFNDANFCFPSGVAAPGASCTATADCRVGTTCFLGTCTELCDVTEGAGACLGSAGARCAGAAGCECRDVFPSTTTNPGGVCAVSCPPNSEGACPVGTSCVFVVDREDTTQWLCAPLPPEGLAAPGAECGAPTVPPRCVEGYVCSTQLDGVNRCVETCRMSVGAPDCSTGDICLESTIDGLGICRASCDPYPRTGGAGYGCANDSDTCRPLVPSGDFRDNPIGICELEIGSVAQGGTCFNPGFLAGSCVDFAACLAAASGDPTGSCFPLCAPFSGSGPQCGAGNTCSAVPPALGNLAFSFCLPPANPQSAFQPCASAGAPCAEDGTLCVNAGAGAQCYPICRAGLADCASYPGRSCAAPAFTPGGDIPEYIGLCI